MLFSRYYKSEKKAYAIKYQEIFVPHFVVEYTDNIKDQADIRSMLVKVNQIIIAQPDLFPIGGIRSRAIELQDYVMSDDEEDYAFVARLTDRRRRSMPAAD